MMVFSPQESAARRQFHEIFCTKYIHTGLKKGALNEDSWNAQVLHDILHCIYVDNPLTPQDIEAIMQISGMYDEEGEVYFHLSPGTPLLKELVLAISPFITTAAYVKCQQTLNGRELDSVGEFLTSCCCADIAAYRVPSATLYAAYHDWCKLNKFLVIGKRAFSRRLSALGYNQRKGYVDKRPGVNFYFITFDKEAVTQNAKSRRTQEEIDKQDSEQPVWHVVGAGAKISPKPIQSEERGLSSDEERQVAGTDFIRNDAASWKSDGEVAGSSADDFGDGEAFDDFDWGSSIDDGDKDTKGGYQPAADDSEAELRTTFGGGSVQERVTHLPMAMRQCFKLSKVTYKIAPEHFDREEFDRDIKAAAGPLAMGLDEMYALFVAYAEGRKEI